MAVRSPSNQLYLSCANRAAAQILYSLHSAREPPQRTMMAVPIHGWLKSLLAAQEITAVQSLDRMTCERIPETATTGRWAMPTDIPMLAEYQKAYNEERGTVLSPDWHEMVEQRRVAVLEQGGRIVSIVKESGLTGRFACISGSYTIPEFRRRGFAKELARFIAGHLLQVRPSISLLVESENLAAIQLYRSAGFRKQGECRIVCR